MPAKRVKENRPAKSPSKPRGRQSKYTLALANKIIAGLSQGTPLTILCEPSTMPSDDTVRNWAKKDAGFAKDIAGARERGFDRIAVEALRIADSPLVGETITDKPEGREVKLADMLGHRRLQVETRLKLLAKWDPKRYGDRITQEISGPDGGPIQTESEFRPSPADEAVIRRISETRQALARKAEDA